jgi:hypothetical protein
LALFGPTVPGRFGLRAPNVNLVAPLNCRERRPEDMTRQACWRSGRCVYADKTTCVDDLSPTDVLSALADVLGTRR